MLDIKKCKWINVKAFTQWIAGLGGFFVLMQIGLYYGWTSPNIVRLTEPNSTIHLTKDQVSWLVSCPNLAEIAGVFFGFFSTQYLGSKHIVIITLISLIVNWICLIVANSIGWIFAARIISGTAHGISYFYFPFHLGDISAPKIRGTLIALATCGMPIGLIISNIAQKYLSMKMSSYIYLIMCVFLILSFLWIKDSPYDLARKGKYDAAKRSIAFYNPDGDIENELNNVINFVQLHEYRNLKDEFQVFTIPSFRKSFFILIMLNSITYLGGITNLLFYMEVILIKTKLDIIKPEDLIIYTYIMTFLFGFLTMGLTDVLGRRIVLIIASIGTALGMTGLGLHFYLLSLGFDAKHLQWLPILSLLSYFAVYSVGYIAVPNALISELFSTNSKILVMFLDMIWESLLSFGITLAFQPMIDLLGEMYVFWIHAALSLLSIPYALFLLPETKGKTFQEIQCDLNRKKEYN